MTNKEIAITEIMNEIKSNYPQLQSARLKMIQNYVTKAYEEGFYEGYNECTKYSL